MKIKLQHICILLALAAVVVCLCFPLIQFIYQDYSSVTMTNFQVENLNGTHSASPWALGGLLIAAGLCDLFVLLISPFQNFGLQKRGLILAMLIITGYYIVYLIFLLVLKADVKEIIPHWTSILPVFSLILDFMAFIAIRHTEAKIIASGNSFRLRD